jgi:CheY-like chemotaxis protein
MNTKRQRPERESLTIMEDDPRWLRAEPRRTIRLLLVEDNPGDVRLMREVLARIPDVAFEVVHAPTLKKAMSILTQEPIEVVLLDLGLPDSMGLETLERIRTAAQDVPIIVLTGLQDDDIAVKSVHARAQDFLTKGEVEPGASCAASARRSSASGCSPRCPR